MAVVGGVVAGGVVVGRGGAVGGLIMAVADADPVAVTDSDSPLTFSSSIKN